MQPIQRVFLGFALAGAWAATLSTAAADTVIPLAPGTLPNSVVYTNGSPQVQGTPGSTIGGIDTYTLTGNSYNYGQTFGALTPFTPPGSSNSYAFYVDYVFTIAPSQFDSLTSTINLGTALAVNGLQARLYDYSAGTTTNTLLPAFTPNGPILDSWSTAVNLAPGLTATDTVIKPTTLGAGTYVLEIRASSVGTTGGSYGGVLNLTPVPLPAGLPLLISGLAGLGLLGRRQLA